MTSEPPVTTPQEAARLIALRFPELAGARVERMGAGSDHDAFVVGGRFVFRFPNDGDGALAAEARLTQWLSERLPIPIPRYAYLAEASPRSPAFGGYALLPGRPALGLDADLDAIGARLGELLAALHASDVAHAAAIGVPADDDPSREQWSAQARSDVGFARDHGHLGRGAARRWERYLAVPVAAGARTCLVHGDLAAEHVLLDDRAAPSGVIDWSDACIGDPARDLAGLVHWGGHRMLAAASAAYGPIDDALLERARWLAACRAVADVAFGTVHGRPAYVTAGLRALAHVETTSAR